MKVKNGRFYITGKELGNFKNLLSFMDNCIRFDNDFDCERCPLYVNKCCKYNMLKEITEKLERGCLDD